MNEPGLLIGGIAMLAVSPFLTALMVFLGMRYSRTANAVKSWPVARGTVLASGVAGHSDSEGGTSYSPRITYRYEAFGQTYQSDNFNLYDLLGGHSGGSEHAAQIKASRYVVGHPVEVRYDPTRPDRALLDTTTPKFMIVFLYGMAVFSLVMGGGGGLLMVVLAFFV